MLKVNKIVKLVDDFKLKRLSAYRVPERPKPEVDRQIQDSNCFIILIKFSAGTLIT